MSTIDKLNHFVKNPVNLDINRSRFNRPFTHKLTFNSGDLVPVYLDEVVPGDTFDINVSSVIRMLTPAVPVMDNSFLDLYFFFVPNRLCTYGPLDWQKICGENTGSFWANPTEFTLYNTGNTRDLSDFDIRPNSAANCLGLPIGNFRNMSGSWANGIHINSMPFVAYQKIWNEWFRDQNTQAPIVDFYDYATGESGDLTGVGGFLKVNKLHDYFTSALPSPQKSDPVLLPLADMAPVVPTSDIVYGNGNDLKWMLKHDGESSVEHLDLGGAFNDRYNVNIIQGNDANGTFATDIGSSASGNDIVPANLWADLKNATAVSVNQMRQAFAIQRLFEKDARGGTRYRELLKTHFGVTIPDATIQVPEYLGGKRVPLNITQVLNTTISSTGGYPLGETGAFSNTSFSDHSFIKSFNEFGYIMGVACVRTEQSYSQGIPKLFTRNRRFDWYYPVFANLGEQPIYTRELAAKYLDQVPGDGDLDAINSVFGYQEAWAEYRFHPNQVSGYLAPDSEDEELVPWTYTNKFSALPVLNSDFMKQPASQIGDTLAWTDTNRQFVADFYFDVKTTRPMPVYSIPGLIDHH